MDRIFMATHRQCGALTTLRTYKTQGIATAKQDLLSRHTLYKLHHIFYCNIRDWFLFCLQVELLMCRPEFSSCCTWWYFRTLIWTDTIFRKPWLAQTVAADWLSLSCPLGVSVATHSNWSPPALSNSSMPCSLIRNPPTSLICSAVQIVATEEQAMFLFCSFKSHVMSFTNHCAHWLLLSCSRHTQCSPSDCWPHVL